MSRLDPAEISAIQDALLEMIAGDEIHTSSWMPGSDWRGTPFEAIYEKAAKYHEDTAAKCFGLMVWKAFMDHEDCWGSGHYELDGAPIEGRTYFRIEIPTKR